eukprot:gnl/MRDRNA2_/MRDRNA2_47124_c0_seq1.p1 gnl/MRDRNA2_/MRDRNA2_47124_c0~~gnl/MRDRNA2_/MRDRNA2_47124_c0_seq1.p1  ORF type:complete len:1230 (+),score=285.90 gnl/MRDRNA2_/MRDRNA2_47124_c0_seq1:129-3818(+)
MLLQAPTKASPRKRVKVGLQGNRVGDLTAGTGRATSSTAVVYTAQVPFSKEASPAPHHFHQKSDHKGFQQWQSPQSRLPGSPHNIEKPLPKMVADYVMQAMSSDASPRNKPVGTRSKNSKPSKSGVRKPGSKGVTSQKKSERNSLGQTSLSDVEVDSSYDFESSAGFLKSGFDAKSFPEVASPQESIENRNSDREPVMDALVKVLDSGNVRVHHGGNIPSVITTCKTSRNLDEDAQASRVSELKENALAILLSKVSDDKTQKTDDKTQKTDDKTHNTVEGSESLLEIPEIFEPSDADIDRACEVLRQVRLGYELEVPEAISNELKQKEDTIMKLPVRPPDKVRPVNQPKVSPKVKRVVMNRQIKPAMDSLSRAMTQHPKGLKVQIAHEEKRTEAFPEAKGDDKHQLRKGKKHKDVPRHRLVASFSRATLSQHPLSEGQMILRDQHQFEVLQEKEKEKAMDMRHRREEQKKLRYVSRIQAKNKRQKRAFVQKELEKLRQEFKEHFREMSENHDELHEHTGKEEKTEQSMPLMMLEALTGEKSRRRSSVTVDKVERIQPGSAMQDKSVEGSSAERSPQPEQEEPVQKKWWKQPKVLETKADHEIKDPEKQRVSVQEQSQVSETNADDKIKEPQRQRSPPQEERSVAKTNANDEHRQRDSMQTNVAETKTENTVTEPQKPRVSMQSQVTETNENKITELQKQRVSVQERNSLRRNTDDQIIESQKKGVLLIPGGEVIEDVGAVPNAGEDAGTAEAEAADNLDRRKSTRSERIKRVSVAGKSRNKMMRLMEARRAMFEELPEEERLALSAAFAKHDVNSNGKLEVPELKLALAEMGLTSHREREQNDIYKTIQEVCVLGDVDFFTFIFDLIPRVKKQVLDFQRGPLAEMFNKYDTDGSGLLDREESLDMVRSLLCPGLDQSSIEQLLTKFEDFYHDAENADGLVEFEGFQVLIGELQQLQQRLRHERMKHIIDTTDLTEKQEKQHSDELIIMHEDFERVDLNGNGTLDLFEVFGVLREYDLAPRGQHDKERIRSIITGSDVNDDGVLTFGEFLRLVMRLRKERTRNQNRDLRQLFDDYDRDASGFLDRSEISKLLVEFGLTPKCREDQDGIKRLLDDADADGNGEFDFSEFCELVSSITEMMRAGQRRREIDAAKELGFSMQQVYELRQAFFDLDANGDNELTFAEIQRVMVMLRKSKSNSDMLEIFQQVDQDGSGYVDFQEFMQFMKIMESM